MAVFQLVHNNCLDLELERNTTRRGNSNDYFICTLCSSSRAPYAIIILYEITMATFQLMHNNCLDLQIETKTTCKGNINAYFICTLYRASYVIDG